MPVHSSKTDHEKANQSPDRTQSAAAVIASIDRQIDQVRLALQTLEPVRIYSAGSWQAAWDRHPELRAREDELFTQRGALQQQRDAAAHKAAARTKRQRQPTKCPTCGCRTLAA